MEKQLIISISRDYGSGGHRIARFLAERFGLPIYDHNLLDEMTAGKFVNKEKLAKYDELPKLRIGHRSVRGYSNSPQEAVAEMQFKFLRDKAAAGEIISRLGDNRSSKNEVMFGIRARLEFIHEEGSGGHFLKLEVFCVCVCVCVAALGCSCSTWDLVP